MANLHIPLSHCPNAETSGSHCVRIIQEHNLITKHRYGNCSLLMCTHIAFLCYIAIFISLSNFLSQTINFKLFNSTVANSGGRAVQGVGLRQLNVGNASSNPAGVMDVSHKNVVRCEGPIPHTEGY